MSPPRRNPSVRLPPQAWAPGEQTAWGWAGTVWPSEPPPEVTSPRRAAACLFRSLFLSFFFDSMFLVAQLLPWPRAATSAGGRSVPVLVPQPSRVVPPSPGAVPRPSVHRAHPGPSRVHTVPFAKTLPLVSWGDQQNLHEEGRACARVTGRPGPRCAPVRKYSSLPKACEEPGVPF